MNLSLESVILRYPEKGGCLLNYYSAVAPQGATWQVFETT